MSLATICRRVALLVGVQPADVWANNPDVTASEIVAWVNEGQARVAADGEWQALLNSFSAALDGSEEQVIALPSNFSRLVPDGVWVAEPRRRVPGPQHAAKWEALRRSSGCFWPAFTIADGNLLLRGGRAGDTLTVRYYAVVPDLAADSANTALGSSVAERAQEMERVIVLAAVALYRDAKGLPAQAAMQQYADALRVAKARDAPVGELSMDGGRVPRRNWSGGPMVVVSDPEWFT